MSENNESADARPIGPFAPLIERAPLPVELGAMMDLQPIQGALGSVWLLLNDRRELLRLDATTGECVSVANANLDDEPERPAWNNRTARRRLHVSARGDFAAVVNDYGRFGQVLDLRSGRSTMTLDGGDYHPETVPFSLAFAELRGKTVLIHRTSWNRLDISDPGAGELLTERGPTSYESGQERPAHYLDFFHGGLHVSPGSKRLLDDGWIWHPVGVLAAWSIEPWLLENRWESEDGATKLDIAARDDWDCAATWLDDHRLAIYGIGEESDEMIPGARIFDVSAAGAPGPNWHDHGRWARELIAFPGPSGKFFSDGTWLFSSDASGLARWDPATGALAGRLPGYEPSCFHPGACEFGQLGEQALLRVGLR